MNIYAVVVTYNRKALLLDCINALLKQKLLPQKIIIVDNASTDGTIDFITSHSLLENSLIELIQMPSNLGGAGGFKAGQEHALKQGADWVWMMDDDAAPHPTALFELVKVAVNPLNVYGSLAVKGENTSWQMTILNEPPLTTIIAAEIPEQAPVMMVPFLGFYIHKNLVAQIGLPDEGFFIAADDVEYSLRAKTNGAQIIIAGNSRIEHPASYPYKVHLPGYTLTCIRIPPWKRYYDTRNRILIAKKYYGIKLYTQTLPGSFVRMFATLINEPEKVRQLKAFWTGLYDAILGNKGKRHDYWNL